MKSAAGNPNEALPSVVAIRERRLSSENIYPHQYRFGCIRISKLVLVGFAPCLPKDTPRVIGPVNTCLLAGRCSGCDAENLVLNDEIQVIELLFGGVAVSKDSRGRPSVLCGPNHR
ncbi:MULTISPECIES: hypothetical protein [Bradyrhizobium]|uniref:Uncharacterized protein n=1 Tax=Bradyrhizobium elkanii TaxID=29448 RepID=A0A4U6RHZ5_BRAEL|nr:MULTISPECIES: hypothetical protein [Bradyrhizobium]MTV19130.1 hypothetical protein [Bradyrhizobium sp. BR2003]TKV74047.1 hypothetical protein FDV58_34150 [Bradyrhizobium elkanii]